MISKFFFLVITIFSFITRYLYKLVYTLRLKLPVPVNKSGENFSPKPLWAPPPEGGTIADVPLVFDIRCFIEFNYSSRLKNT